MKEFETVLCTLIIVGLLFVIGYIYHYLIINFGVGGLNLWYKWNNSHYDNIHRILPLL